METNRCLFLVMLFPFHSVVQHSAIFNPFSDLVLPHSSLSVPMSEDVPEVTLFDATRQVPVVGPTGSVLGGSVPSDFASSGAAGSVSNNCNSFLVAVRRSSRVHQPPVYLKDYHCNLLYRAVTSFQKVPHCISHYLSYDALSHSHRNLVLQISSQVEPQFYYQAMKDPHWRLAMQKEL
ncbi:hypothetical protein ACOSQ4_027325 [Xanthoceras sorbifolium]